MIEFYIEGNELCGLYSPDYYGMYIEKILEKIKEDGCFVLKHTFHLTKEKLILLENDEYAELYEESLRFKVGRLKNDYIFVDKELLDVSYDVCFDKEINLLSRKAIKYFSYGNISILKKVIDTIRCNLYIEKNFKESDDSNCHITIKCYEELIKNFPTNYELKLYSEARIEQILSEYLDKNNEKSIKYENYLAKKDNLLINSNYIDEFTSIKLDLLNKSYEELKYMLSKVKAYSEIMWQIKLKDILCAIFPKYVLALREVNYGKIRGYDKHPDFTLIDANGYIDIMEIKKPDSNMIMRDVKIRNNYVPQKIFIDTVTQIAKYIDAANKNSDTVITSALNKMEEEKITVFTKDNMHINNPKGILLFGRTKNMNDDMMYDYQIIKRQYKDIVEIISYDELLQMMDNLIKVLSMSLPNA